MFRSPKGFQISSAKTDWIHVEAPRGNRYISTVYKAPYVSNGLQPSLTVRVDNMSQNQSLDRYMRQWQKDYTRLGFEVINSKKVLVGKNTGFLMDLIYPKTKKQLRQIIFAKRKTAVVITCRDHESTFRKSVHECNQIIRNFDWL